MVDDEAILSLREALAFSPDNVPLRRHLAETLLAQGRSAEAAEEYQQALLRLPDDSRLQLGLATAFFGDGRLPQALVLVERAIERGDGAPSAHLLHARLLLNFGEPARAASAYRRAVEHDLSLSDPHFAEQLGIGAGSPPPAQRVSEQAAHIEPTEVPGTMVESPRMSFADVGGMEPLKEEIRAKIIHPLEHPELYRVYGKPVGGGILMYGPPGCGKTHLARATAGQISAAFLAVSINDVLDMWLGNSERNLHALFEAARRLRPAVLFFDEVDALAASRADLRYSGGRMVINQFLAELDGVGASNDGVLVLAATNAPWQMDSAFRRPGRFDRILFVPPPDPLARASILMVLCRDKPQASLEYAILARQTEGFSGADLKAVVNVAVELKLREAMRTGIPQPLTTADLSAAARNVKPSTREWFATARSYARYANEGGQYDDVMKYLQS
ncbi:MAG: AAA family ATPase [Dehalococcoidia bacterium]